MGIGGWACRIFIFGEIGLFFSLVFAFELGVFYSGREGKVGFREFEIRLVETV